MSSARLNATHKRFTLFATYEPRVKTNEGNQSFITHHYSITLRSVQSGPETKRPIQQKLRFSPAITRHNAKISSAFTA